LSNSGQATSDHFSPLKCKTEFKRNLYWDLSGKEPLFSGVSFVEWQKTGRDRDSQIADPQFLDVQRRDFRLRPTSPALAMGFKPIAIDQAGLYGNAAWVAVPLSLRWESLPKLPPPPPPPPPRPLLMDFESDAAGALPVGLNCSPRDRLDALQVTEETAAGGKRSLKFIKTDGLKYGFQPHVFFSSNRYASGRVRFACEILNSAQHPAECYVGLRDYTDKKREYLDGPSIQLQADGTLVASGKPLTKMPLGKWLHLEIQFDLGQPGQPAPAKSYRLLIAVAGEQPQVFNAVPYLHPEFSQLTWFGFSSGGKLGSVFYVDNVRLEPVD
jgi:hypothetical protein